MRQLILAGLIAAVASPLLAQPAPVAPVAPVAPPMPRPMMMGMDKTMTRAEVQAQVQAMFARRDANHDGFLTADELAMGGRGGLRDGAMTDHAMPPQAMGVPPQPPRDPNAAFDRIDANHDGAISRDELAKGHEMRVERRVVINGQPGADGMPGMAPGAMRRMRRGGGGGGMMGAAMLRMADANHDGRVSLAEATAGALQHFDMMDTNHDGSVTPEERQAGRARMMPMGAAR